ncbi:hypothetical protein [Methanogenium organophilum]|uniref:Uncharacterized protein n=1 Tax=Methanogenium organophilum TaxID=2199 RepID=A0A9X9S695_METOG|nr:hypothetical protein [Methanogenium organophilum]WAI02227.1 hypothetical protein OU421_04980 [Methanogenium organophilum]
MFSKTYAKISSINSIVDEINKKGNSFFDDEMLIVYPENLKCINFTCFEGAFFHVISGLYLKYIDNKKSQENLKYLLEKTDIYGISPDINLRSHIKTIQTLRTFFQHDILKENKNNRSTKRKTYEWFQNQCGNDLPITENDWKLSLNSILDESSQFFLAILDCVMQISNDEEKKFILENWTTSLFPFSVHDVSEIVSEIFEEKGIEGVNSFNYTKKNYQKFIRELKIYEEPSSENLKRIINSATADLIM